MGLEDGREVGKRDRRESGGGAKERAGQGDAEERLKEASF
jgi:hypothetical protein